MPEGKFGIQSFADIDKDSTPAQDNNQPFIDDPFCGNDNNRRAYELLKQGEAEAKGEVPTGEVPTEEPAADTKKKNAPKPAPAPAWKPNA